jgi:hypothetical protein
MRSDFRRDRLTWVVYVVAGWFAYLQAAPGLVVVHLRDELGVSYSVAGCTSLRLPPVARLRVWSRRGWSAG